MLNESHTRKEIIDKRLLEAGWDVTNKIQVIEEYKLVVENSTIAAEPEATYITKQFSDYVLLGSDGKPLAVVEAKKSSVDSAIGREQAKQYCYNIQKKQGGDLPFCFFTNGHEIFFWDLEHYPPRKVHGFPTRDDFQRYKNLRKSRKALAGEFINTKIAGRDYQQRAIRSVLEAVEKRKRKFLLVMATGTGKTRTCIALVEALMRAGWAEKVLFLVDRIALRDQTLDAFKEHLPNEPRWPKLGEKSIAKNRRIYVSTYPTMLNVIRDENNSLSPHFFDLVVVDESHRSIYNTYQEILDYFNTITLGLTATPTDVIDHNTFQLFECEEGVPTYAYSYEEAVNNIPPYLINFQVMKIKTKFQDEGINTIFYHIECIYLDYKPEGFEGEGEFNRVHTSGFFPEMCFPDAFELEYRIPIKWKMVSKTWEEMKTTSWTDLNAHIRITKKKAKVPIIECLNKELFEGNGFFKLDDNTKEETSELSRIGVKEILPDFIVGYSSGENEILSLPFLKMRFINFDEYDDNLRNETGYARPEGRLVYVDTTHSQAVFLANFLMQDESTLKPIFETIGVKSIRKFRIIINQNKRVPKYRPVAGQEEDGSIGDQMTDFFELTSLLQQKGHNSKDLKPIDKLIMCATSTFFDQEDKVLYLDYFIDEDFRDEKGEILRNESGDLIGLSETKKAFRAHFDNNPLELFRAFQVLLTLNHYGVDDKTKKELYKSNSLYVNETIPILASEKRIMRFKEFEILKGKNNTSLLSKSLSDGEHQYLHTLGICLLFRNSNSLFLLDEPETHFNPDWRAKFISTLRECLEKDLKGQNYLREILITSHSPFIISDCHEENVLVFKKQDKSNNVIADRPGFNTFGASVNEITIEIFERSDTIGDLANGEIQTYLQRFENGEDSTTLIKELNRNLGDSVEKTILINKIRGFIKD